MKTKQTLRSLTCVHYCISWSDSAEILVTSLAIVLAKKGQFSQGKKPFRGPVWVLEFVRLSLGMILKSYHGFKAPCNSTE